MEGRGNVNNLEEVFSIKKTIINMKTYFSYIFNRVFFS